MTSQCERVVLLACGSFNPPTIMHLRMFELARDFFRREKPNVEVVGGVVSPTHDAYQKKSLIPAPHRLEMARRAVLSSDWVRVSDWETRETGWTRTRRALDQYHEQIHQVPVDWLPNAAPTELGPMHLKLLCGADLLESFSVPDLWDTNDIRTIVRDYGIVVISREGSNPERFIEKSPLLLEHSYNIHIVTDWISNDVSSTKIREAVGRGDSIKYLVPDPVIQYIQEKKLYTALSQSSL